MKLKFAVGLALTILLTSCGVYQRDFDCPPGVGVPCTSVTDIEAMIIETECGPDLFLGAQETCCTCKTQPKSCCNGKDYTKPLGKVWICPQTDIHGNNIDGHYMTIAKPETECQ